MRLAFCFLPLLATAWPGGQLLAFVHEEVAIQSSWQPANDCPFKCADATCCRDPAAGKKGLPGACYKVHQCSEIVTKTAQVRLAVANVDAHGSLAQNQTFICEANTCEMLTKPVVGNGELFVEYQLVADPTDPSQSSYVLRHYGLASGEISMLSSCTLAQPMVFLFYDKAESR